MPILAFFFIWGSFFISKMHKYLVSHKLFFYLVTSVPRVPSKLTAQLTPPPPLPPKTKYSAQKANIVSGPPSLREDTPSVRGGSSESIYSTDLNSYSIEVSLKLEDFMKVRCVGLLMLYCTLIFNCCESCTFHFMINKNNRSVD